MIRFLSVLTFCFFIFINVSTAQATTNENTILVLGDSLSAGYQMKPQQAWPHLLSQQLDEQNLNTRIINASVSGDTTGNGLARITTLLELHKPNWVIIELGANDGLRGFPPARIQNNLASLITKSQDGGAEVILMQIRIPPNYGKRYNQLFNNLYPTLAEQFEVPLIPFFLEHVITKPEWMMSDGLHPKAEAQPWIANYIGEQILPFIKTAS
ncbi:arylesterase [Vibrio tapetis]|nr:arylesterase [Vibrio tapetis]